MAEEHIFKSDLVSILGALALLDEGATIPFIARYRKEKTGELDDAQIRSISERREYIRGLDEKKTDVYNSILAQDKMTEELCRQIEKATTLAAVEDLYRPYRPKRKTRASVAREKGLEPLAKIILSQDKKTDIYILAEQYVNGEKGVETAEDAVKGACDIIAEDISDDAKVRTVLKSLYNRTGIVQSKGDREKESVYTQYYDFAQPVNKIPGHRVLALNRGEKEGFLKKAEEIQAAQKAAAGGVQYPQVEEKPEITIDDFDKIQIRVGEVLKCEPVPKAKKLLVSQIRIGDEVRQIVSGIAKYYKPEEMVGKKVAVITNLKPCKLCGVESQGMILAAADDADNLSVLTVDKDMIAGSEIR